MKQRLSKIACFALAQVFTVNVVWGHLPQQQFWSERRQNLAAVVKNSSSNPSFIPLSDQLLNSAPRFENAPVPVDLRRALSNPFGSVRRVSLPVGTPRGFVVYIQDIHQNAEAQTNIAHTVSALLASGKIGAVALEGAEGSLALRDFQNFEDATVRKMAADYFLGTGELPGPVYAAMLSPVKVPLVGIEKKASYDEHVAVVRKTAPLQKAQQGALEQKWHDAEREKAGIYNLELRALDEKISAYRDGTATLSDYATALEFALTPAEAQTNHFLNASRLEKNLDFAAIEREREQAFGKLLAALPAGEQKELADAALAFRNGALTALDFYTHLQALGKKSGFNLSQYPAFEQYVTYIKLCDQLDAAALFAELARLEKRAVAQLALSAEEKTLADRSRQLALARKLVRFELTQAEWLEIASIPRNDELKPFEDFYRLASLRDHDMAERVLRLPASPEGTTVLVTGGFHAPGLTQVLTNRGLAVVEFVPKISKLDGETGSAYLSAFTQEKTPLEKLFRGEKLFISDNPSRVFDTLRSVMAALKLNNAQAAYDKYQDAQPTRIRAWGSINRLVHATVAQSQRAIKVTIEIGSGAIVKLVSTPLTFTPLTLAMILEGDARRFALTGSAVWMAISLGFFVIGMTFHRIKKDQPSDEETAEFLNEFELTGEPEAIAKAEALWKKWNSSYEGALKFSRLLQSSIDPAAAQTLDTLRAQVKRSFNNEPEIDENPSTLWAALKKQDPPLTVFGNLLVYKKDIQAELKLRMLALRELIGAFTVNGLDEALAHPVASVKAAARSYQITVRDQNYRKKFMDIRVRFTRNIDDVITHHWVWGEMLNDPALAVHTVNTLVNAVTQPNTVLATVRSTWRHPEALAAVTLHENGSPSLLLGRSVSPRAYSFQREIVEALKLQKLPFMPGVRLMTASDPAVLATDHEGLSRLSLAVEGKTVEVLGFGHSARTLPAFLTSMKEAGVVTVVDIRSRPQSQNFPQFNRKGLSEALKQFGIQYEWQGDLLGGKQEGYTDQAGGFESYMLENPEDRFTSGIERLLKTFSVAKGPVLLMCSEKHLHECHREPLLTYLNNAYGVNPPETKTQQTLFPLFGRPTLMLLLIAGSITLALITRNPQWLIGAGGGVMGYFTSGDPDFNVKTVAPMLERGMTSKLDTTIFEDSTANKKIYAQILRQLPETKNEPRNVMIPFKIYGTTYMLPFYRRAGGLWAMLLEDIPGIAQVTGLTLTPTFRGKYRQVTLPPRMEPYQAEKRKVFPFITVQRSNSQYEWMELTSENLALWAPGSDPLGHGKLLHEITKSIPDPIGDLNQTQFSFPAMVPVLQRNSPLHAETWHQMVGRDTYSLALPVRVEIQTRTIPRSGPKTRIFIEPTKENLKALAGALGVSPAKLDTPIKTPKTHRGVAAFPIQADNDDDLTAITIGPKKKDRKGEFKNALPRAVHKTWVIEDGIVFDVRDRQVAPRDLAAYAAWQGLYLKPEYDLVHPIDPKMEISLDMVGEAIEILGSELVRHLEGLLGNPDLNTTARVYADNNPLALFTVRTLENGRKTWTFHRFSAHALSLAGSALPLDKTTKIEPFDRGTMRFLNPKAAKFLATMEPEKTAHKNRALGQYHQLITPLDYVSDHLNSTELFLSDGGRIIVQRCWFEGQVGWAMQKKDDALIEKEFGRYFLENEGNTKTVKDYDPQFDIPLSGAAHDEIFERNGVSVADVLAELPAPTQYLQEYVFQRKYFGDVYELLVRARMRNGEIIWVLNRKLADQATILGLTYKNEERNPERPSFYGEYVQKSAQLLPTRELPRVRVTRPDFLNGADWAPRGGPRDLIPESERNEHYLTTGMINFNDADERQAIFTHDLPNAHRLDREGYVLNAESGGVVLFDTTNPQWVDEARVSPRDFIALALQTKSRLKETVPVLFTLDKTREMNIDSTAVRDLLGDQLWFGLRAMMGEPTAKDYARLVYFNDQPMLWVARIVDSHLEWTVDRMHARKLSQVGHIATDHSRMKEWVSTHERELGSFNEYLIQRRISLSTAERKTAKSRYEKFLLRQLENVSENVNETELTINGATLKFKRRWVGGQARWIHFTSDDEQIDQFLGIKTPVQPVVQVDLNIDQPADPEKEFVLLESLAERYFIAGKRALRHLLEHEDLGVFDKSEEKLQVQVHGDLYEVTLRRKTHVGRYVWTLPFTEAWFLEAEGFKLKNRQELPPQTPRTRLTEYLTPPEAPKYVPSVVDISVSHDDINYVTLNNEALAALFEGPIDNRRLQRFFTELGKEIPTADRHWNSAFTIYLKQQSGAVKSGNFFLGANSNEGSLFRVHCFNPGELSFYASEQQLLILGACLGLTPKKTVSPVPLRQTIQRASRQNFGRVNLRLWGYPQSVGPTINRGFPYYIQAEGAEFYVEPEDYAAFLFANSKDYPQDHQTIFDFNSDREIWVDSPEALSLMGSFMNKEVQSFLGVADPENFYRLLEMKQDLRLFFIVRRNSSGELGWAFNRLLAGSISSLAPPQIDSRPIQEATEGEVLLENFLRYFQVRLASKVPADARARYSGLEFELENAPGFANQWKVKVGEEWVTFYRVWSDGEVRWAHHRDNQDTLSAYLGMAPGAPREKKKKAAKLSAAQKAEKVFEDLGVLKLVEALRPSPGAMYQILTVLLAGQEQTPEETERLLRDYIGNLNLGEGMGGNGALERGIDSIEIFRRLMETEQLLAHIGPLEQEALIEALIRFAFNDLVNAETSQSLQDQVNVIIKEQSTAVSVPFGERVKKAFAEVAEIDKLPDPDHIITPLMPHQRRGSFLMRRSGDWKRGEKTPDVKARRFGFLNLFDPRMGKTLTALAALDKAKNAIIVPANTLSTWQEQIQKHTRGMNLVIVRGTPAEKRALLKKYRNSRHVTLLMSLQDLRAWDSDMLGDLETGLDTIIIDEAQNIENFYGDGSPQNSRQAEVLHNLKARRKWLLTATPYTSGVHQLFSAFHMVHRNPVNGEVNEYWFRNYRNFRELLKKLGWGAFKLIFATMISFSIRAVKSEFGDTYSRKKEIPYEEEGLYQLTMPQSRLMLQMARSLTDYLPRYNRQVPAQRRYESDSVSVFLKRFLWDWAASHPDYLGEHIPTHYWSTLDKMVAKRAGKKGAIVARSRELVQEIAKRYRGQRQVVIINSDVSGRALDENGETITGAWTKGKNAELIFVPGEGDETIEARDYARHLIQGTVQGRSADLVVLGEKAGVGIQLDAIEWMIYAQVPENYVTYHQSSERGLGFNPFKGTGKVKEVEILFMMPEYDPEFLDEMRAEDARMHAAYVKEARAKKKEDVDEPDYNMKYIENGTPQQLFYKVMMEVSRPQFLQTLDGVPPERRGDIDSTAARVLGTMPGFLEKPARSAQELKDKRRTENAGALYLIFDQINADPELKDNRKERAMNGLFRVLQTFTAAKISAQPLGQVLLGRFQSGKNFDLDDLKLIAAQTDYIPNKELKYALMKFWPELYTRTYAAGWDGWADAARKGPLAQLAKNRPELWLPVYAATHGWKKGKRSAGADVINDIVAEIDLVDSTDTQAWDFISTLIPLIDLKSDALLQFLGALRGELLDSDVTLGEHIKFFQDLATLRVADRHAYDRLLKTRTDLTRTRAAMRTALHTHFDDVFEIKKAGGTLPQIAALEKKWAAQGGLDAPLRFMARLRLGDPRHYQKHLELFRTAVQQIVRGTFSDWRNKQSDPHPQKITYREKDKSFWETYTREEIFEFPDQVIVKGSQITKEQAETKALLIELLANETALAHAFGEERAQVLLADLKDKNARAQIAAARKDAGARKQTIVEGFKKTKNELKSRQALDEVGTELAELGLRELILNGRDLLINNGIFAGDKAREAAKIFTVIEKQVLDVPVDDLSQPDDSLQIRKALRDLLDNLLTAGESKVFQNVRVEFTSDPIYIIRNGELHPDLIDCGNLYGGISRVATLVEDLIGRNKMMALVYVGDELAAVSFVKVRKARKDQKVQGVEVKQNDPIVHIDRPRSRLRYSFVPEIARAAAQLKSPGMNYPAITEDFYGDKTDENKRLEVDTTGTVAPTEFVESFFAVRRQEQDVWHYAKFVVKPNQKNWQAYAAQFGLAVSVLVALGLYYLLPAAHHDARIAKATAEGFIAILLMAGQLQQFIARRSKTADDARIIGKGLPHGFLNQAIGLGRTLKPEYATMNPAKLQMTGDFASRTRDMVREMGIKTVAELVTYTPWILMHAGDFKETSAVALVDYLDSTVFEKGTADTTASEIILNQALLTGRKLRPGVSLRLNIFDRNKLPLEGDYLRAHDMFKFWSLRNLRDLVHMTPAQMMAAPDFKEKSLRALLEVLDNHVFVPETPLLAKKAPEKPVGAGVFGKISVEAPIIRDELSERTRNDLMRARMQTLGDVLDLDWPALEERGFSRTSVLELALLFKKLRANGSSDIPLTSPMFSADFKNTMKKAGVETLQEVLKLRQWDLDAISNISLAEVDAALEELARWGLNLESWDPDQALLVGFEIKTGFAKKSPAALEFPWDARRTTDMIKEWGITDIEMLVKYTPRLLMLANDFKRKSMAVLLKVLEEQALAKLAKPPLVSSEEVIANRALGYNQTILPEMRGAALSRLELAGDLAERAGRMYKQFQMKTVDDLLMYPPQVLRLAFDFGPTSTAKLLDVLDERVFEFGSRRPRKTMTRTLNESVAQTFINEGRVLLPHAAKLNPRYLNIPGDYGNRARDMFKELRIRTVGELVKHTPAELMAATDFKLESLLVLLNALDRQVFDLYPKGGAILTVVKEAPAKKEAAPKEKPAPQQKKQAAKPRERKPAAKLTSRQEAALDHPIKKGRTFRAGVKNQKIAGKEIELHVPGDMGGRLRDAARELGLTTINDVVSLTPRELMEARDFKATSYLALLEWLEKNVFERGRNDLSLTPDVIARSEATKQSHETMSQNGPVDDLNHRNGIASVPSGPRNDISVVLEFLRVHATETFAPFVAVLEELANFNRIELRNGLEGGLRLERDSDGYHLLINENLRFIFALLQGQNAFGAQALLAAKFMHEATHAFSFEQTVAEAEAFAYTVEKAFLKSVDGALDAVNLLLNIAAPLRGFYEGRLELEPFLSSLGYDTQTMALPDPRMSVNELDPRYKTNRQPLRRALTHLETAGLKVIFVPRTITTTQLSELVEAQLPLSTQQKTLFMLQRGAPAELKGALATQINGRADWAEQSRRSVFADLDTWLDRAGSVGFVGSEAWMPSVSEAALSKNSALLTGALYLVVDLESMLATPHSYSTLLLIQAAAATQKAA